MLAASAAAAQGVVTLYGGARGGGEFIDQNAGDAVVKLDSGAAGSLSFEWLLADGRQAQVLYSYQRSALPGSVANGTGDLAINISYLHLGGRVYFEGTDVESGSYLVGGLGITHLAPSLHGLSSEVRPSMNLGLGYQWMLSKKVALRTEVRGYLTLIHSSGGFFCSGAAAWCRFEATRCCRSRVCWDCRTASESRGGGRIRRRSCSPARIRRKSTAGSARPPP